MMLLAEVMQSGCQTCNCKVEGAFLAKQIELCQAACVPVHPTLVSAAKVILAKIVNIKHCCIPQTHACPGTIPQSARTGPEQRPCTSAAARQQTRQPHLPLYLHAPPAQRCARLPHPLAATLRAALAPVLGSECEARKCQLHMQHVSDEEPGAGFIIVLHEGSRYGLEECDDQTAGHQLVNRVSDATRQAVAVCLY